MSSSRLIVRNVLSTFGSQIVSWLLTFIVMLYLPRYLGVEVLGKLAFATSVVILVGAVVPLGTSTVLVKEIARERGRAGELLMAGAAVRIPLAFIMALTAVLVGRLLHCPALTQTFILFLSIGMIVSTLNDLLSSALRGMENMPRQSVSVIVEKILYSGLTIALVIYKAPFWIFAAIGIPAAAVSALVNITAFSSLRSTMRLPKLPAVRDMVTAGMPFAGWAIFQNLYGASDPFVLGLVCDNRAIGWYAAAVRLTGTTAVLPVALCSALMPTMARLYTDNQEDFRKLAQRMMALIILSAAPIAAIFVCIPEKLIALLHYPPDFYGTVPVLRLGGLGVLLYFIAMVLATTVIAGDGQHRMFRTSIYATLIGIPACVFGSIVTQHLWKNGAIGAMCSDIVLEVYLISAYTRMLPRDTLGVESLTFIGRTLLAALPLVALTYLTDRTSNAVWGIAVGLFIYVILCWRLKCLDPQVLLMIRKMITRRQHAPHQN